MTVAVMTRSPLQTLTMTSTQRTTRRRTAIHAFDDENDSAQPFTKKAKVDSGKSINGRVNGETMKKAMPSYDEDDNGFQFSRAKSKKAKATTPPAGPAPVAEAVPTEAKASPPAKKRRKKYSFSDTKDEAPRATRRSARLSGDKKELQTLAVQQEQQPAENQHAQATNADSSVAQTATGLQTPKTREPKKIALPFADTPIMRRNKEMRKKTGESAHRRSSTGLRGRRASSLIDSGTSNGGHQLSSETKVIVIHGVCIDIERHHAFKTRQPWLTRPLLEYASENQEANSIIFATIALPHTDVEPLDFFKHIEQSLPEPRRMKQLLTWCGTRALPEKQNGDAGDGGALLAARHIEEEILKDIANRPELSDWFSREELAPAVLVKKENPRNTQMASKLTELEQEIKRLQDERDEWEVLLAESARPSMPGITQPPEQSVPQDGERRPKLRQPPPESTQTSDGLDLALLDPEQAAIYTSLMQRDTAQGSSASRPFDAATVSQQVSALAAKLEPAIDIFADGVHKVSQYRLAAERVADKILSSAADGLEKRSRDTQAQAAAERGVQGDGVRDVKDVLHALAGVLSGE